MDTQSREYHKIHSGDALTIFIWLWMNVNEFVFILKISTLSLDYPENLLHVNILEARMVFEHHDTIHCAHSTTDKTFGAWCKVTTICKGKSTEFIHNDLQAPTCQMMSFIVLMEIAPKNCLFVAIAIAWFLAMGVFMTSLATH